MKCYYHPEEEAVATCQHCGKSLCKDCASKYTPCLCDECYGILRKREAADMRAARKPFLITLAIAIVLFLIVLPIAKDAGDMILAYLAFFIPFGWKYANLLGLTWFFNFNPSGIILMIFVYLFRALVAVVLGIPCFIVALVKFIKLTIAARTREIENIK